MKLVAKQAFSWAHRGVEVESFSPGQEFDTEDADLVEVATREGWAQSAGLAPSDKSLPFAPENRDAAKQRGKKG